LLRLTRMYANFAPPLLEPLPSNEAGRSSEGVPSQWPAPTLWNSLPATIRTIDFHPAFRRALKTHLFRSAFDKIISVYRATRMHSADYAMARCLSVRLSVCLSVRPSVCPSHAVLCVNSYTYPQSLFSPSGSPNILVFPYQTEWQYSDGDPLTGAPNARG